MKGSPQSDLLSRAARSPHKVTFCPSPKPSQWGRTVEILGTELTGRGQRSDRCIGEKRLDLRINCAGRNNDEKRPKVSARALY